MPFEIVVAPLPPPPEGHFVHSEAEPHSPPLANGRSRRSDDGPLAREVLEVFLNAAPTATQAREVRALVVLRDLALALIDLAPRKRAKVAVRAYDEPWELCIERFSETACLSVYRTGSEPFVAVYDRAVPFDDVVMAARDLLEGRSPAPAAVSDAKPPTLAAVALELASAMEQLRAIEHAYAGDDFGASRLPARVPVVVEADRDAPLSFGAEFAIRDASDRAGAPVSEVVERSDMHALLFRGRVRAEIRGRTIDLGECHPVLLAERLVDLARRAFDAWERGLALHARAEASGVVVGVRVSAEGELALTLGATQGGAARTVHTFPALGVGDVLEAALAFGRALVRAILRRDRAQSANLRLGALRRTLRESSEALRNAHQSDSKVNPAPEPYRAFAASLEEVKKTLLSSAGASVLPTGLASARLRYAARWRAIVPGIDLRATYLCGDRVIVGAAAEMWALDRSTGHVIWRADTTRGTSVVTPGGIARLAPDGRLSVHDFGTGEPTLRARIVPRVGPVAGAVVHLPGLPRLVVVTEGEHHLVAVDLATGEPRWRWSWGKSSGPARGAPRMKRAGKLLYFTCGDSALTALDVMSGAVVWRLRDRLRFRTPPTIAHDAMFVVAGGAHGVANLYSIDSYSGRVRWSRQVADAHAPCTVEGAPLVASGAVAVAVRQKSGLALVAFRREDGEPISPRGRSARSFVPTGTAWLAVDDVFIGNAPSGEVVAVEALHGDLRWRHVLGPRPLEADVPRRLEPVLRCGALFVPCSLIVSSRSDRRQPHVGDTGSRAEHGGPQELVAAVSILRPSDGATLGTIAPTEAIPDLLRVDERCDVYLAEDSGHLVAFGALPRLALLPSNA